MIKKCLTILCLLISSCHASLTYKGIPEENYIEEGKKYPAVCQIYLIDNNGKPFGGSGTLCKDLNGNKFILTSAHIINTGDLNYADNCVMFTNGFSGHIINMKIFDGYLDSKIICKYYVDIGLIFLNEYPLDIEPMKIGVPDLKPKEERIVTAIGYGRRGIYDPTGRGHYIFSTYKNNEPRAVHLKVKEDSTYITNKDFSSLTKVFDSTLSLNLEGGLAIGSSGGPTVHSGEIIAMNNACAKDIIYYDDPTGAPIYRALTNPWLHDGCVTIESFIPSQKMYFRQTAKWLFHLPDFSIKVYQYMTLLTPKIQQWIYDTVKEVNK